MSRDLPHRDRESRDHIQSDRRQFRAVMVFFMSFYFLLTSGHFFSSDEIHVYQTTRSLLTRGDLSIDPINDAVTGRGGKYYSHKGLGPSLVSAPLHAIGLALHEYLPNSWQPVFGGRTIGPAGEWGGDITIFTVNLFNGPVTALLCALLYLFALEFYSPRTALVLALTLGLSTVVCVYARTYFHNTLMSVALVGTAYLILVGKRQGRYSLFLLSGGCLGLAVLTRFESILLVPLFLLYLMIDGTAATMTIRRPLMLKRAIYFSIPVLVATLCYVGVNKLKFGSFWEFGVAPSAFGGSVFVGLYGHLFSVGRSVFLYSPPLLLSLACWRRFYRSYRLDMTLWLGIFLVYLIFYSKFGYWHGGWGWGNRYLLPVVPFLLLPMGLLVETALQKGSAGLKVVVLATCLFGVSWQLLGATPYIPDIFVAWEKADLNPPDSYFYVPEISAPVAHWEAIVRFKDIDYWLYFVYTNYGVGLVALLGAPALLALFFSSREICRALMPVSARAESAAFTGT